MKLYYEDSAVLIYHGDNREFVGSADVVLTDPPYSLAFMGKEWDKAIPHYWDFDAGWLFAFGGTRTWHRLACAIEDAGWQYRDTIMWLYGQGFPKGHNNLKPAWEPILVARKYGDLDIDAARIPCDSRPHIERRNDKSLDGDVYGSGINGSRNLGEFSKGRWPANLVLECTCDEVIEGTCNDGKAVRHNSGGNTFGTDKPKPAMPDMQYGGKCVIHTDPDCPCRLLDEQSGELPAGKWMRTDGARPFENNGKPTRATEWKADASTGGASRFFYCAKASKAERGEFNNHPCVKPLKLMEWLIKLSGGQLVLDPFMGSGTTLVAAKRLGRKAIGIEIDEHSCEIAARRCQSILV